jgi:hypothetical protein
MIQRLRELFALMLDGNREYMNPSAFFDAMAKFKPSTMLVKGVQNDYYELWVSFLDAIEAGLKEVLPKDHPLMEELRTTFYGRAEENLMYSEGDSEIIKASETTFGVVNIDSKDGELYKAFRNCQSLTIDEYLPDGGQPTQAKIEVKLMEPPKVLSFYINRLTYDLKTKRATKNNGVFQFDEVQHSHHFPRKFNWTNSTRIPKPPPSTTSTSRKDSRSSPEMKSIASTASSNAEIAIAPNRTKCLMAPSNCYANPRTACSARCLLTISCSSIRNHRSIRTCCCPLS